MTLSPYQVLLMREMYAGQSVSWSYAPPTIRHLLYDMIYRKGVCDLTQRRVGDDPREYEFVILSKKGRAYCAEGLFNG